MIGLSQLALADAAGITRNMVNHYEQGQSVILAGACLLSHLRWG